MTDELFTGDKAATTLAQATDWLRLRADKGVRCPCCKQYVKIYKRTLGSQMARWLIWLVRTWEHVDKGSYGSTPRFESTRRAPHGAWVDIRLSPVRGGDYAKLAHWGLVEQKPNDGKKDNGAKDTKDSGYWRPTYKGIDFVRRRITVPSHVYLYDNVKLKEEERMISIDDALGKKYSYDELMNAPVHVEVPGL